MIWFVIGTVVSLIAVLCLIKGLIAVWYKMHALVGIEVGLPHHTMLGVGYQQGIALPTTLSSRYAEEMPAPSVLPSKKFKQRYWQTRYGKVPSLTYLKAVNVDKLDMMPVEAVQALVTINDRLARYAAWQQQASHTQQKDDKNQSVLRNNWLTEKQFVLNRLVDQTLPTAINQYEQLARFNPQILNNTIHDGMTPGQLLIAVLIEIDSQLDDLLNELSQQVSHELATTYRYVKARVQ